MKTEESEPYREIASVKVEETATPIKSIDISRGTMRIIVLGSKNDIGFYSLSADDKVSYEYTINISPIFVCKKAFFASKKEEVLIACENECRVLEWTTFGNEIKFSYLIENFKSIKIVDMKINPSQSKPFFLVSSDDGYTRLWNTENKICVLAIKNSSSFAYEPKGSIFVSLLFEKETKKHFFNFYSFDDFSKQPISSYLAKNGGTISSFGISKNSIYLVTYNDLKQIIAYYMWNLEKAKVIDLNQYSGFSLIGPEMKMIEKEEEGFECEIPLINKSQGGKVKIMKILSEDNYDLDVLWDDLPQEGEVPFKMSLRKNYFCIASEKVIKVFK